MGPRAANAPGPHAVPAAPSAPPLRPRRTGRDEAGSPVQRALAILELLGAAEDASSLGVVEIARQLGRDKSQVSRALKHLADAGFVDRETGSLRYRIGTRLFSIGARAVERRLRDEADMLVEREAARLGERVEVCVRSGGTCMTISTAAPETELRAVGWVGRTVPLSCTAVGRALLFDLDTAAVARLLVPTGLASGGAAVAGRGRRPAPCRSAAGVRARALRDGSGPGRRRRARAGRVGSRRGGGVGEWARLPPRPGAGGGERPRRPRGTGPVGGARRTAPGAGADR